MSKNTSTRRASGKRNLAVAGFLLGGGAAMAITTSGVASAEPHLNNQQNPAPNPIVSFVQDQLNAPKPGTYYSDGVYQAWCANFVSFALREAGAPLGGINGWRNPAVVGLQKNFAEKGILENRNYVPKPGDTVLYGGDHTNIVVDVKGDEIVTIGGNENNGGISHRTLSRNAGKITGYGRTSELVAPAAPAPAPEVVNPFAPPPPPPPVEPHPVWGAPPPPPAPFVEPFNPFAPPPPPPAPAPAPFVEPAPAPAPVEHLPAPPPAPAPFVEPAPAPAPPPPMMPWDAAPPPPPAPAPEMLPPAPFVEPAPSPAPAPWDMAPPPPPAPFDPFLPPPPAPEAFMPPPPSPMPWELPPPPAPDMFAPPAPMPELPPPPPPAPWEQAPVVPVADAVPAPGPGLLPPPPAPGGIYLLSALP